MFSVVVCTYLGDDISVLRKSLESIHNQKLLPSEIVLVQDGPISSEADSIIRSVRCDFQLKNIFFKHHIIQQNVGHGEARRTGIAACEYDIIALCDSDDINLPHRFDIQYGFLDNHPEITAVGANIQEYLEGALLSTRKVPSSPAEVVKFCKLRCPMNQMTVMFRKRDVLAVGGYLDFYHNEDYFLWIRLIKRGYMLANIPEVLVEANINAQTFVRRGGFRYFKSEWKLQVLMLKYKISNPLFFIFNVTIRLFIQLFIPSSLRQVVFRLFFRD